MSTRAEKKQLQEEAQFAATVLTDLGFGILAIVLFIYLLTGYNAPSSGLGLVLTVFFGSIIGVYAFYGLYKLIDIGLMLLGSTPEEAE